MDALEKKLGYEFKDKSLLTAALTHSSYANENKARGLECNERLEFLGDSVLGMLTAGRLYVDNPGMPEGKMTRLRSELVCERSLYGAALKLGLGSYIRLGRGEALCGGMERPSILADAVEAVIAALYLDGGVETADIFVERYIFTTDRQEGKSRVTDYKTALQELVQRKGGQHIAYRLLSEQGPDHDKLFNAEVVINDKPAGQGEGRSKKEAEQNAAKSAFEAQSSKELGL